MKTIEKSVRSFKASAKGSSAILFAVTAPVLLGFAAFAVDVGLIYTTEAELQESVDEVALAAMTRLRDTKKSYGTAYTEAQLKTEMVAFAGKNVPDLAGRGAITHDDMVFGKWDFATNSFDASAHWSDVDAIQVTGEMSAERGNALNTFFASIFTDHVDIGVSSIAVLPVPPGFHVLSETESSALYMGNSDLDTAPIVVNSSAHDALVTDSTITSWPHMFGGSRVDVAGQVKTIGRPLRSDKVYEEQPGIRDFLEDQQQPRAGGCGNRNFVPTPMANRNVLNPGTYCGLTIETPVEEVIFRPGQYVFADEPVVIRDQQRVGADGAHFFFTGKNATLE